MPTTPGSKISQLAEETTTDGTEYFVFAKSGTNKKILSANLGLGGYITKTYAQAATLKTNGTLVQGALYFLSDKYIYVRALNTDEFELTASYIGRNADYDSIGNYSGVAGFGTDLGIWYIGLGPSVGDVVIYNNLHYKNLTGAVGAAPSGDAVNWVALAISETNGYIYEIDSIEYDFSLDWIQRRIDKRGNDYKYSKQADVFLGNLGNQIANFQWGRDYCHSNIIQES